jgi:hypothetical protein
VALYTSIKEKPFMRISILGFVAFTLLLLTACETKTEELDGSAYERERLEELVPLQVGKYITYRLDSTVFTNFGRIEEVHSYQEKHVVDAEIQDNLGRISYRIFRFLRDTTGAEAWKSAGTYFITVLDNKVEVVENNLRVVRLVTPVKEGTTWKGNQYLPNEPYKDLFSFGNDNSMNLWEFKIDKTNETLTFNGETLNNVVTVLQADTRIVPDTIEVTASNEALIPANVATAWIRGTATDNVTIQASNPSNTGTKMAVYNRTNFPAQLNGISIPQNMARIYEFSNGQWTFDNGKDTLISDLPFASVDYAVDKYAPNIGLIYQELILWENQPNIGGSSPFKVGFGVKRTLLEHN